MNRTLPENLSSLHQEEERIRAESLQMVEAMENLSAHLSMLHGAMALIYALAHDHKNNSDDELTLQYLGLRIFNAAAASVKLALSGYYQISFASVRDIIETVALLDYFRTNKDKIAIWKASNTNQRISQFGPSAIRKALDERDGFSGNKRKEIYGQFSEYASHAAAPGFQLLAPEGLGCIGPFLSKKYLTAWLEDATKYLVQGALVFECHFPHTEPTLLVEKATFLAQQKRWCEQYISTHSNVSAT